MNINLTDNEIDELVLVLENFLPEFSAEIDSVIENEWHDDLKTDAVTLSNVLNKLRGLKTPLRPEM